MSIGARIVAPWHEAARRKRRAARQRSDGRTGGERGIRTPGTLPGSVVFKTTAIDHSAISPRRQLSHTQKTAEWRGGFYAGEHGRVPRARRTIPTKPSASNPSVAGSGVGVAANA